MATGIAEWLIGRTETTTNEIFRNCISWVRPMGKPDEMRVGAILSHLRWKKGSAAPRRIVLAVGCGANELPCVPPCTTSHCRD